jgi:predicted AAA+ superfamily ATPase
MERQLQKDLLVWKKKPSRLPLIIRGARQVGKTYIMKWLGKNHFEQFAYFNFDERPEIKEFFKTNKHVDSIVEMLSLTSGAGINEKTLLIFDEIQECPEALNSLKYFAENKPEIPVICAGSYLGLLLNKGNSFPVGKVEFITLHPMTFREVLPIWDANAAHFLQTKLNIEPIPQLFYNNILQQFKKYLITGGMPAALNAFNQQSQFEPVDQILQNLLLSYKGDFAKHPVMSDIAKITHVYDSLPTQLSRENKKFVFQLVRQGARAREYEDAIQWLINAGLIHRIWLNNKPALPLSAYDQLNAFKIYNIDVGLMRKMSGLSSSVIAEGDRLFTEFKGALTENYILQSIISQFEEIPRYWTSGNTAEVDFLLQLDNQIIPVEVKSDRHVKSRSLTLYRSEYNPPLAIRYSLQNIEYNNGLINIPLFLADYTKNIIQTL